MKPIFFIESNGIRTPPQESMGYEISSLPVWTDGTQCISCWQMTWIERITALLHGKIWVAVLSGRTQPPISVMAEQPVFPDPQKED